MAKINVQPQDLDFSFLNSKEVNDVSWWKWSNGNVMLKVKIKIDSFSVEKQFEGISFEETLDKVNHFWFENKEKIEAISKL